MSPTSSARVLVLSLVALLPSWSARAALPDCSEASIRGAAPDDARAMLDRAFDWVHRSVDYCQCVTGAGGPYRTDCSGFVSYVWELPGPGHTTYSFAGGPWDDHVSRIIGHDELLTGDAMNFPGDPGAGTGHVVLFAGWRNDAHTRFCAIEESHSGTPARVTERFVDPAFLPIRLSSRAGCTQAHCEGSEIVTTCGRGDCAVFASRCVQDDLGARCAFFACPDRGEQDVCLLDGRLGHCSNGTLASVGDCGVFGASCVADNLGARCVFAACPAQGRARVCFSGSMIGTCNDGRLSDAGDCAVFGQHCIADGNEARCGVEQCPATGRTELCSDATHLMTCDGGAAVGLGDCATFAAYCSDDVQGASRCVSAFCAPQGQTPVAHTACWIDGGQLLTCDDVGAPAVTPCPDGEACTVEGGTAHCAPRSCPETGSVDVCLGLSDVGHCVEGSMASIDNCAVQGGFCTTSGGTPHCAQAVCADDTDAIGPAHDVCLPSGEIGHCDDDGVVQTHNACPSHSSCQRVDGTPTCVATSTPDAGTDPARDDAGTPDDAIVRPPSVTSSGCGCTATTSANDAVLDAGAWGALLGGLAMLARRRSARARR